MKIKNRTSIVNPQVTAQRIEQILAEAGVASVSRMYSKGEIVGFEFVIQTQFGNVNFRMPIDTEKAYSVLYAEAKKKQKYEWRDLTTVQKRNIKDQASRTAWKISQEWIQIQLSMVAMKQAELVQVFMPYATRNGVTLFDAMKQGGYTALLSAPSQNGHVEDGEIVDGVVNE